MIGETSYRIETDPGMPEDQFIVKQTIMDLAEVNIGMDADGVLKITEREPEINDDDEDEPADGPKYRLQPEGNLFRLVALRQVGVNVFPGQFGGLVGGPNVLDQVGECWISRDSSVTGDWRIRGDAQVNRSTLDGHGYANGSAKLNGVTMDSPQGYVSITSAALANVTIDGDHSVTIVDNADIRNSVIHMASGSFSIAAGLIDGAELYNRHEVVSVYTRFGWLSAYRGRKDDDGEAGQLRLAVGCQRHSSFEGLRNYALSGMATSDSVELAMLPGFEAMVTAAQTKWTKSAEQIAAAMRAEAEKVAADTQVNTVTDFKELAQKARAAGVLRTAGPEDGDPTYRW